MVRSERSFGEATPKIEKRGGCSRTEKHRKNTVKEKEESAEELSAFARTAPMGIEFKEYHSI